ncbi:MAG: cupredoxin domain-containing protein [Betaproteobacteria bacterium]|nr:cupredoxin domain-containing protein [Betaproteobacteria bacterium]
MRSVILLALLVVAQSLPARADNPVYVLTARDGRLTPATLDVPAGQRFKIVIKNAGRDAIEFESLSLKKEKALAPGAESFVVIAPLKPGNYDFFDEFHPDTAKGRIVAR